MKHIYLASIARLRALEHLFTCEGLKPIQHFDYFKNQYIYPELHHIYKKPALFFEYRVAWRDRDRLIQDGDVTLRYHLELENYAASFDRSKNQETALEIFAYHRLVKGMLHGWAPAIDGTSYATRLKALDEQPDLNPTTTNVHIITFECKVTDDTALQIEKLGTVETIGDELALTQVPMEAVEPDTARYQID